MAVIGILDITEMREKDRNALLPNGAVAVVANGEQVHHAVHLVERSVERRARHAPHVDATQLRTACEETRRVLDEMHFVQDEAPPLHAKQWRDEGGEGSGASQLPLPRHEDVVILFEAVIACEDDVELRQILGKEKEWQARGFYDSREEQGGTLAVLNTLQDGGNARVEDVLHAVNPPLDQIALAQLVVVLCGSDVFLQLVNPLRADVSRCQHQRGLRVDDLRGVEQPLATVVAFVHVGVDKLLGGATVCETTRQILQDARVVLETATLGTSNQLAPRGCDVFGEAPAKHYSVSRHAHNNPLCWPHASARPEGSSGPRTEDSIVVLRSCRFEKAFPRNCRPGSAAPPTCVCDCWRWRR